MANHVTRLLVSIMFLTGFGFDATAESSGTEPARPATDEGPVQEGLSGKSVEYSIENGVLQVLAGDVKKSVELGSKALFFLRSGNKLYVLMDNGRVAVLNVENTAEPVKESELAPPTGKAVGLFEARGRVWVEAESLSAFPLEQGVSSFAEQQKRTVEVRSGPERAVASEGPKAKQKEKDKEKKVGPIKILNISPGRVKLSVGARQGVKVGDRFAVFGKVTKGEKGEAERFEGRELAAVAVVTAVSKEASIAELGRGDRVQKDDVVVPATKNDRSSRIFPRRLSNLGEVRFNIMPLLKVGQPLGFGVLSEIGASWWGDGYFLDLRIEPLGFGYTEEGNPFTGCALLQAGYDGRAFAVGLGLGVGGVNGDLGELLVDEGVASDAQGKGPSWEDRTTTAFTLSQYVRLGARDGLNMVVTNLLMYYEPKSGGDSKDSGFVYGATTGRINIPLPGRTDLFIGAGGGLVGYWFAEIGVFAWIIGNGDVGSLGLSASAGGAGIWGTKKRETQFGYEQKTVSVAGPMVSFGLVYRFGI